MISVVKGRATTAWAAPTVSSDSGTLTARNRISSATPSTTYGTISGSAASPASSGLERNSKRVSRTRQHRAQHRRHEAAAHRHHEAGPTDRSSGAFAITF